MAAKIKGATKDKEKKDPAMQETIKKQTAVEKMAEWLMGKGMAKSAEDDLKKRKNRIDDAVDRQSK